jgi:DNA-binding MarR family transcriptional regulator/predicted GNAT family N-acyltransferase
MMRDLASPEPAQVARVRSFDRTVTAVIGALEDRFLGRDRPLGEARLLWEVGEPGAEVRDLRRRLGLDAGYASRMLRSLERAGLVEVAPDPADARVRMVRLTESGRRERGELDRRSDDFARGLLGPLDAEERQRLAEAMREVERLLVRARTRIEQVAPTHPDVRWCFGRYYAELDRRFDRGFDVALARQADPADLTPPRGLVLVAYAGDEPVGCGALRLHADGVSEIKRVWVAAHMRGAGLGGRMLAELEDRARTIGSRVVRLDTNRALSEAIAMYRRSGYVEVEPFNDERYAHHWFEKVLDQVPFTPV